jgi:hypothetical protein
MDARRAPEGIGEGHGTDELGETGPTVPRSVRFPARVWRHLEKRAKAQGMPAPCCPASRRHGVDQ